MCFHRASFSGLLTTVYATINLNGEGGGNFFHGVSFFIVFKIEGGGTNLKRGVYLKEHTSLSIYSNFSTLRFLL